MEFIVNLASGFMNLFTLGGEQFMSWVTGIIPTIVMLLVLMNVIQRNVPVQIFALETLAPGIALFGLTFLALFSGLLLARDRTSAFLARLTASPMTAADFLLGYLLPMLPMAAGQSVICMGAAVLALAVVLFRWKMVEH